MSQSLNAFCTALKYDIISMDIHGVKLNYKGNIIILPYDKWEKIESLMLSFFDFATEKTVHETNSFSLKPF